MEISKHIQCEELNKANDSKNEHLNEQLNESKQNSGIPHQTQTHHEKKTQTETYFENDYDFNNLSFEQREIIANNQLILQKYPKLTMKLIKPEILQFLKNVTKMENKEIIQHIIMFTSNISEKQVDLNNSFFEHLLIYLDQSKNSLENKNQLNLTNNNQQDITILPEQKLSQKQNSSRKCKSQPKHQQPKSYKREKKSSKDIKTTNVKCTKNNTHTVPTSSMKPMTRYHEDVSKFGETIFKIT